jgi:hypothetical protein
MRRGGWLSRVIREVASSNGREPDRRRLDPLPIS